VTVTCVDWRDRDDRQIAGLYDAEIDRWSRNLGWDTRPVWKEVDRGRRLGTVVGRLALDRDGTCAGWSFAIVHRGTLQIGGLVAKSEEVESALLQSLGDSIAGSTAASMSAFVWPDAPGLERVLTERRVQVEPYDYMNAAPGGDTHRQAVALRPWRPSDFDATLDLLASAYPGEDVSRPFAPGGTAAEWHEYVAGLVGSGACGMIMPSSSFVATAADGTLLGLVLVTRLAATTAHIAQLVVAPAAQRQGAGRSLLDAASCHARLAGCDRITLLVARRNVKAYRLYEQSGFRPITTFLSARSNP